MEIQKKKGNTHKILKSFSSSLHFLFGSRNILKLTTSDLQLKKCLAFLGNMNYQNTDDQKNQNVLRQKHWGADHFLYVDLHGGFEYILFVKVINYTSIKTIQSVQIKSYHATT